MTPRGFRPDFNRSAGVGFKPQHAEAIAADAKYRGWFEVHAENYFVAGGPRLHQLETLRRNHDLSLHGVGLSLAGGDPLDAGHLRSLRQLIDRFAPALVSEHLAWSVHGGRYYADLFPVPLNEASLARLEDTVDQTQNAIGRAILVENPARYIDLPQDEMHEAEFLSELVRRTGCGLLLDVNNVYVGACNLGFDAAALLAAIPAEAVGEIHLAGHIRDSQAPDLLIDNHGARVADPVWDLYRSTLARIGPRPTLIEWDNDIPAWPVLRDEARQAATILDTAREATQEQARA
jgi:uncharacterized protein (UPF0276 family)